MKFTLNNFKAQLRDLIHLGAQNNLPIESLLKQQKDLARFEKQANCAHNPMPKENNNIRVWICTKCQKVIDYETTK